jgi:hypothetical protein
MAIAVIGDAPDRVMYERVRDNIFPEGMEAPAGGIAHAAGELPNGTVCIVDIWETREAYDLFREEKILPALEKAGADMSGDGPQIVELFELMVGQEARA